jgi:hypothetical protein
MKTIDESIKGQRVPNQTLRMQDTENAFLHVDIDSACDGIWFDLAEVIRRCKIMSKVKASSEAVK